MESMRQLISKIMHTYVFRIEVGFGKQLVDKNTHFNINIYLVLK